MSLAGGRAPRKTAGNRLSGLLEAEEEDEFYQTTYGGFTEESGDDEYQGDQSDTEDEVDSDFDIDEGDEPSSDGEAEEPRRKRRVVTKAYKEPLKSLRPRKVSTPAGSSQKAREEKVLLPLELQDDGSDSRKSMRQSTAEHTRQTFLRVQERQGQSRRRKGPHCERPLTQEELLREAKITEELNLRSLAILGMYTLMSNKQYYDAICSGEICNTEGISSVVQPDKYKPVPDEPPNPTNIEEILKSVRNNDKELEEVNLNNIQDIPIPMLTELCEAMKTNTYVRSLSLVATRSGDPIANAVADMLRENRSLQSLNIESNFISSTGLMAVLKAVRENATLTELRVDNQRQWPGDAVEMEMATVLEQCPSIVRFGYHFTQQGPRARAAQAMTRNNELRRQQKKR
uniref:Tropomodulin 4 n=1 Tax=Suricata suricatta TaxID=37032 RepID=A0A673T4W4_SURSU